jgi:hypothetical protein
MAEMNSTYNAVHDESVTTWKFQRLGLVLEFAQSSVLPAPLGIFEDLLLLCPSWCRFAGGSATSSHGARVIWEATLAPAAPADSTSSAGCSRCSVKAGMRLPEPVLNYLRDARDWVQWMAAAMVVNLQLKWGGWTDWRGYFPQGWAWEHGEGPNRYHRCLNNDSISTNTGITTDVHHTCPCEVCLASSLRQSANVMVGALEAWARARAEKDTERAAAVEAAAAAAASAERMARLQAEKVGDHLV